MFIQKNQQLLEVTDKSVSLEIFPNSWKGKLIILKMKLNNLYVISFVKSRFLEKICKKILYSP